MSPRRPRARQPRQAGSVRSGCECVMALEREIADESRREQGRAQSQEVACLDWHRVMVPGRGGQQCSPAPCSETSSGNSGAASRLGPAADTAFLCGRGCLPQQPLFSSTHAATCSLACNFSVAPLACTGCSVTVRKE